jgi:hypothetical protein
MVLADAGLSLSASSVVHGGVDGMRVSSRAVLVWRSMGDWVCIFTVHAHVATSLPIPPGRRSLASASSTGLALALE